MAYIGQTPSAVPLDGGDIADDIVDSQHYAAGSIDTAHLADDQITLAKMAAGTDGNIISYDASGNPVAIATGSSGQVLTSGGAGAAPSFAAAAAGGKVLQVVSSVYTGTATSTSTTPAAVSGFSAAITCSATSSKVLVHVSTFLGGVQNVYLAMILKRNGTEIGSGTGASGSRTNAFIAGSFQNEGSQPWKILPASKTFLDSPSSTSALTYQMYLARSYGSAGPVNLNASSKYADNQSYIQYMSSTITLMEIGA
jgi:hypothetical protein